MSQISTALRDKETFTKMRTHRQRTSLPPCTDIICVLMSSRSGRSQTAKRRPHLTGQFTPLVCPRHDRGPLASLSQMLTAS